MKNEWDVLIARKEDFSPWMSLVSAAAEDFPGLETESYSETLRKNIARGTALCAKENGKIIGILLFSPKLMCLSCMAVDPAYRRRGVASALIAKMLSLMPGQGEIAVTTFRAGDPKGDAPRALYRSFGFREGRLLTEFGYPVQQFTLKRPSAAGGEGTVTDNG